MILHGDRLRAGKNADPRKQAEGSGIVAEVGENGFRVEQDHVPAFFIRGALEPAAESFLRAVVDQPPEGILVELGQQPPRLLQADLQPAFLAQAGNARGLHGLRHLPQGLDVDGLPLALHPRILACQGVVSEILSGKRELNVRQVRALTRRFGVGADAFP